MIGNTKGGDQFARLTRVESDLIIARSNLQTMGFYEDEIVELIDRSNQELEQEVNQDYFSQIRAESQAPEHTCSFILILYVGHAILKNKKVHSIDVNGNDSFNL